MADFVTVDSSDLSLQHSSQQRFAFRFSRAVILSCILGIVALLLYFSSPTLIWAYNISRAGQAMDAGLMWPELRRADSLPQLRNQQALGAALDYLAVAERWQPGKAYTYRLKGQVFAAEQQWDQAAAAFEQARVLEPKNGLLAWESSLIYEQLLSSITQAPQEDILPDLASATPDAPVQPIKTSYCKAGQPQTCYVGLDSYTLPYASLPNGPTTTSDVLFMHPPAAVRLTRPVYADHPALSFALGLDPNVRNWRTDGATFEIRIKSATGQEQVVYNYTIDRATAQRGWVPGWADLSPWAGQSVTITFRTTGGPSGDTTDDWYAWGNVKLTTVAAAKDALLMPAAKMRQAWQAASVDDQQFMARGDVELQQQRYAAAQTWYQRATAFAPQQPPAVMFRRAVTSIIVNDKLPADIDSAALNLSQVKQEAVQIQATTLQWLFADPTMSVQFGDRLSRYPAADPNVGVLWWGNAAATLINVPEAGSYRMSLRAQHTPPAPIEIQLEHDMQPIAKFSLARGDNSWQEIGADISLKAGLHVVGVRFLNDGAVGGIDRNAVLDWIRLEARK